MVEEYDPPLLCPESDRPEAFGQSTPVPWFWKNDPINVSGSALVPVHSAFMICVRALRKAMHVPEHTPFEKSVAVHPDNGVLYAFSQAEEKPLICCISERVTAVVKGRSIASIERGRGIRLRMLL